MGIYRRKQLKGFLSFRDSLNFNGRYKLALNEIRKQDLVVDYETESLNVFGNIIENEFEFLKYMARLKSEAVELYKEGKNVGELMEELNLYRKMALYVIDKNLPIFLAMSRHEEIDKILEKNGFVSLEKLVKSHD
ncbi:hypothetical protein HYX16_01970 [Candidatus Woesearchaeota archaeon]|nr:hypothetical protein [Candidatus Woesearchaeota archaeon]